MDEQNETTVCDGLVFWDGKVLDDRNMPGETLGIRRLQSPVLELVPLRKCAKDVLGILKSGPSYFVDSNGKVFRYRKTVYSKLKYYKIKKVVRKNTASVLWLKGVNSPFTVPHPPPPEMEWAGLLHLGPLPWLLYEYSEEHQKDTRRKI